MPSRREATVQPTEIRPSNTQARRMKGADLILIDHLAECPNCRELCPPSATVCECGTHLYVRNSNGSGRSDLDGTSAAGAERRTIPMVKDCTCGGRGTCTRCVLAEYEGGEL